MLKKMDEYKYKYGLKFFDNPRRLQTTLVVQVRAVQHIIPTGRLKN